MGLGLGLSLDWSRAGFLGGVGWVLGAFGLENQLVCVRLCLGAQVLDWSRSRSRVEPLPPFDDSVSTRSHFGA